MINERKSEKFVVVSLRETDSRERVVLHAAKKIFKNLSQSHHTNFNNEQCSENNCRVSAFVEIAVSETNAHEWFVDVTSAE